MKELSRKRAKKACNGYTELQNLKNVTFQGSDFTKFFLSKARVTVTRENWGKSYLKYCIVVSYKQKKRVTPCNLSCNPPAIGLHF